MEDLSTVTIGNESTLEEIDTRTSSEEDEEENTSRETGDVTGEGDGVDDGADEATEEVDYEQEQVQDEDIQVNDTNKENEPEIIDLV